MDKHNLNCVSGKAENGPLIRNTNYNYTQMAQAQPLIIKRTVHRN